MDILDILLDILLKPPQPFIGLFFGCCCQGNKKHHTIVKFVSVGNLWAGNVQLVLIYSRQLCTLASVYTLVANRIFN